MENGLTASDIALLGNNGGNCMNGMGGAFWIFALLILAGGGFGNFGNNGYNNSNAIQADVNRGFDKRRNRFKKIIAFVNILPNSFNIARKWNLNDHAKRTKDGSITYDYFTVTKDKVEYSISKCMYVEMFKTYGIQGLCKIFCMTDEWAYAGLPRHVVFIRHSDLSNGPACCDEVIRRKTWKN